MAGPRGMRRGRSRRRPAAGRRANRLRRVVGSGAVATAVLGQDQPDGVAKENPSVRGLAHDQAWSTIADGIRNASRIGLGDRRFHCCRTFIEIQPAG